jgi:peptide/nickel transport system permease protein
MAATADAKPLVTVNIPREGEEESQFRLVMRRFRRHKLAVVSLVFIIIMFVLALLAPVIAPFPRDAIDIAVATRPGPPGTLSSTGQLHLLGVDHLGRDLFTRVLYGARVSLTIAFLVVILQEGIGVTLGALSGFHGGWIDNIVSRTVEFLLSLPLLPILLITASILIRSGGELPIPAFITNGVAWMLAAPAIEANKVIVLIFILVVLGWTGAARLMRGMALTLRNQDFVESLRAMGASNTRIIFRHMVPNVVAPYLIMITAFVAQAILAEASLSFLGLGVTEPTASWGLMLSGSAADFYRQAPWMIVFPGIAISLAVFAFNLFGDSLRDWLDPKIKV